MIGKSKIVGFSMALGFYLTLGFTTTLFAFGGFKEKPPETKMAVVSTANWAGLSGEIALVNVDDPSKSPIYLPGVNSGGKVLLSPDKKTAYVLGLRQNRFGVVNLVNKTSQSIATQFGTMPAWDMKLSEDGSKLFLLTFTQGTNFNSYIEIYDTKTLKFVSSINLVQGWTDRYRGYTFTLDPTRDVLYVVLNTQGILSGIGASAQVRAYKFDGTMIGKGYSIDPDIKDFNNYSIEVDPKGDLLLAVSSKIFPFKITATSLVPLNPIAGKKSGDDSGINGKTKVLFAQDHGMIYVNSSGLALPGGINYGGSAIALNKTKILNNDPNPYVFSLIDFTNDQLINWIVSQLPEKISNVSDIIDPGKMYGIADSAIEGNTAYMIITSIAQTGTEQLGVLGGKYILAIFKTLPLVGNVWVGGKVLNHYPTDISIDSENDLMVLSYWWDNQVGLFKRDSALGWLMTSEKQIQLKNRAWAVGAGKVPANW